MNSHSHQHTKSMKGFSLLELMIVVTIIVIIVAIAVPSYVATTEGPNAASAIESMKILSQYELDYYNSHGAYADLDALNSAGFVIDPSLRSGTKSKYRFTVTPSPTEPNSNFVITATPLNNGWRHFYTDATRIIRVERGTPATASSQPIE